MDTISDRLFSHASAQPDRPAMWFRDGEEWKNFTWRQYADDVERFAGALLSLGYEAGDAVAIMGNNSPQWVIADVAAMHVRAVPAGIYQTSTLEQAVYIAEHCEARVMVLESADIWNHLDLDENRALFPNVEVFVAIKDADEIGHSDVESYEQFLRRGDGRVGEVSARHASTDISELATLIYTSGTTGPPKGVMLSHHNLAWTSKHAVDVVGDMQSGEDCIVSYLPLSHIAEQMFSIHLPLTAGVPVWFAENILAVRDTLIAARPALFLGVPRVWEKFKNTLDARLSDATGVKKFIVDFCQATLLECGHIVIEHGEEKLTFVQRAKYRLANRLFADKLKAAIGFDRLKLAITSAAPISYEVLEFFLSCGIILHEAYGQSEDNGPTTINFPFPGRRKLGSAGVPFPGTEVRIASDGEILVKGENVFIGYYKDDEATKQTLVNGWLHSGDIGEFDDDGFLTITDRKKDLIITAGGKNVAPQNIEKSMRDIDGISQVVVIGDQRKYLVALCTLDVDRVDYFAEKFGTNGITDLVLDDGFKAYIEKEIELKNREFARYETVKKFRLLPEDFSVESGELTPTQKVKRRVVNERFSVLIEGMYTS